MECAKRKGSNYASHDMQEEMLKVKALKKFREIAAEIRSAEFYVIMTGETYDITNTKQLMTCIRWVDEDLSSREEFIGIHSWEITNANTIVKVIKNILLRMNISLSVL